MSNLSAALRLGTISRRATPPTLGVFAEWRLQAYGYTLAAFYAVSIAYMHYLGVWLLNQSGEPVYSDFTNMFVAGWQALHGEAISVYDPAEHIRAQDTLVGSGNSAFSNWPYPPIYFLILAPLAQLPYVFAFFIFEATTLLGLVIVVYCVVRRPPAITLVLASPFTAWNFLAGQSGFLSASLVGAALFFLEHRPMLAGVFIGCLTYKPQFGLLFPVALIAARQWRAFGSAAATAAMLVGLSAAAFGNATWEAFPRGLLAQADINLFVGSGQLGTLRDWGILQTVYGLVRRLGGSAALAWVAQGIVIFGIILTVWCIWRSRISYHLKAAVISGGSLIATPYALGYDLTLLVIPIAFLASEQIRTGWLKGEQTILISLFVAGLSVLPTSGHSPLGFPIVVILLALVLRRALCQVGEASSLAAAQ
jgi:hypothetical protein